MRLRIAMVAALTMLAIASATRSYPGRPTGYVDMSDALNSQTAVPPDVMSTLRRACFDCHSDETRWPWYATFPIAYGLLERDVAAARGQMNLSHWTHYTPFERVDLLDKMCELASMGNMPPWRYRMLHGEARLPAADVSALCAWSDTEAARLVAGGGS